MEEKGQISREELLLKVGLLWLSLNCRG